MKFQISHSTMFRETVGKLILVFVRSRWANQNPTNVFFKTKIQSFSNKMAYPVFTRKVAHGHFKRDPEGWANSFGKFI